MFLGLKDSDAKVRRTCLLVVTHLVLIGQIKINDNLYNIAELIDDQDEKIKN